jgi:hypothetical protein
MNPAINPDLLQLHYEPPTCSTCHHWKSSDHWSGECARMKLWSTQPTTIAMVPPPYNPQPVHTFAAFGCRFHSFFLKTGLKNDAPPPQPA